MNAQRQRATGLLSLACLVILLFMPMLMRLPARYLRPPLAPPERRLHLCHCVFRE